MTERHDIEQTRHAGTNEEEKMGISIVFVVLALLLRYPRNSTYTIKAFSPIRARRSPYTAPSFPMVQVFNAAEQMEKKLENLIKQQSLSFPESSLGDVDEMNNLLSSVADCLARAPNEALSLLSQRLNWLFEHNIPG